jgi:hypothetical protein
MNMAIINKTTKEVTANNDDLNDSIVNQKNVYYTNIVKFLKSVG